jgi:N-acylneuraminate cytidylyltransferase
MTKAEVLAIVPARGGSESIPRKNVRSFAGHPLLAYSIAAGLQAATVNRTIVSTDDEEIAEIAKRYGAEVPFMRPAHLAERTTPDLPVFQHALEWLDREQGYRPEEIVHLRPTSPLRPLDCVDGAIEALLTDAEADCTRGVVSSGQNPYKMWRIDHGRLSPLLPDISEAYNLPRQELPPTYWQTGHIDAIRSTTIMQKKSMTGDRILPWLLAQEYSVDIDNDFDWSRAERSALHGDLEFVRPEALGRVLPRDVQLLVLDFDGVLTDDRVWVSEDGAEAIAAHRGDGYGIATLKDRGVAVIVLTRENNPVVAARCEKLGVEAIQGISDKGVRLEKLLKKRDIDPARTIYVGNDVNDLPCFPLVGFSVAVSDAHPDVIAAADMRLSKRGGHGAVRELCDMLLER